MAFEDGFHTASAVTVAPAPSAVLMRFRYHVLYRSYTLVGEGLVVIMRRKIWFLIERYYSSFIVVSE